MVHARPATAEEAALRVAPSPEGQVAASEDGQGTGRAVLKEEQVVPPMPPGAFFKEEGVVPPMPSDTVVKQEVVVKQERSHDGRAKRQRKR